MAKATTLIIDFTVYFAIVFFLGDYLEKYSMEYIIVLIVLISIYHVLKQLLFKALDR